MIRRTVWAAVPLLAAAACSDGAPAIDAAAIDAPDDAPDDAAPPIDGGGGADSIPGLDAGVPTGRHTYVVSRMRAPATANEAQQFGIDLDGRPNDGIDNQLGLLLASFRSLVPSFDASAGLADAVDHGLLLSLIAVRADSLTSQAGAYAFVHSGRDPQPPACSGPGDTICRHHLDGSGAFAIATAGDPMIGAITAGRLLAGPNDFPLPFRFGTGPVIEVPLVAGRLELRVSDSGIAAGSKLGGAIRQTDFEALMVPAIHDYVTTVLAADCPPPRVPPSCGCQAGSSGQSVLSLFDTDDDCTASLAEVRSTVDSVLPPDLDLTNDGVNDAISLGLGVEGVVATFGGP